MDCQGLRDEPRRCPSCIHVIEPADAKYCLTCGCTLDERCCASCKADFRSNVVPRFCPYCSVPWRQNRKRPAEDAPSSAPAPPPAPEPTRSVHLPSDDEIPMGGEKEEEEEDESSSEDCGEPDDVASPDKRPRIEPKKVDIPGPKLCTITVSELGILGRVAKGLRVTGDEFTPEILFTVHSLEKAVGEIKRHVKTKLSTLAPYSTERTPWLRAQDLISPSYPAKTVPLIPKRMAEDILFPQK